MGVSLAACNLGLLPLHSTVYNTVSDPPLCSSTGTELGVSAG